MITPQDVVTTAREYLGVRWHHQGRNHAGVDCIGLVVIVAKRLGLIDFDVHGYGRIPDGNRLRSELGRLMVPVYESAPGDVILMRFADEPQHVAIATDKGIIHSYAQIRKVVEHCVDGIWERRIVASYRFKEFV